MDSRQKDIIITNGFQLKNGVKSLHPRLPQNTVDLRAEETINISTCLTSQKRETPIPDFDKQVTYVYGNNFQLNSDTIQHRQTPNKSQVIYPPRLVDSRTSH